MGHWVNAQGAGKWTKWIFTLPPYIDHIAHIAYIAYIAYVDGPISSQIPMSSPILMLLPAWNHRKFTCRPPGIADAQLWPLSVKYSVGPLWWTPRLMSNCLRCSSARTLCLGSELPENTQPSFNKMIQLPGFLFTVAPAQLATSPAE